jgi:sugar lactone lactonase YvrE
VDRSNNIYVADSDNHLIRKITSTGAVSTLAGSGLVGSGNGSGTSATFNLPMGLAVDSDDNIYVADSGNHLIRKITKEGVVSTFAGQSGVTGSGNGSGTSATFNYPIGIAVDSTGIVYVADSSNHLIRKITKDGVVSTVAGQSGLAGSGNGSGTSVTFNYPQGLAVDSTGTVYVADSSNHLIRKITKDGVVSTLAGSGSAGSGSNGSGTSATFRAPSGLAVDSTGTVYVADTGNHLIRKITKDGVVSTLAGSGLPGSDNGSGTSATFRAPSGLAVDSAGTVYVADYSNHLIRKIAVASYVRLL